MKLAILNGITTEMGNFKRGLDNFIEDDNGNQSVWLYISSQYLKMVCLCLSLAGKHKRYCFIGLSCAFTLCISYLCLLVGILFGIVLYSESRYGFKYNFYIKIVYEILIL